MDMKQVWIMPFYVKLILTGEKNTRREKSRKGVAKKKHLQAQCRLIVKDGSRVDADCVSCISGLECFGNSTVKIRFNDSVWRIDGGVYYLDYCPAGYYADRDVLDEQQCRICGIGVTCADGGCDACTPCPPGSYKSIPGLGE